MDLRVSVVDRQNDGRDTHMGERGIGNVIAQEGAKLFENKALHAQVPVAGPVPPPTMVVVPELRASSMIWGQMR